MLKKVVGLFSIILVTLSISTVAFAADYTLGVFVRICPYEQLQLELATMTRSAASSSETVRMLEEAIRTGEPIYMATFINNDPIPSPENNPVGERNRNFVGHSTVTQITVNAISATWRVTNFTNRIVRVNGVAELFQQDGAVISSLPGAAHLNPSYLAANSVEWVLHSRTWHHSMFTMNVDGMDYPTRRVTNPFFGTPMHSNLES
jgi:hypothetical protein